MVASGVSVGDDVPNLGIVSTFRRESALRMSHQEMLLLAEPFRNELVGHFAYSRPLWR